MIIITADHGREFKTNTEDRILNYKDIDLLHVPLFIKLPNQERGEINKNLVSNIDIVPTIADVLGIDLDWNFGKKKNIDLLVSLRLQDFCGLNFCGPGHLRIQKKRHLRIQTFADPDICGTRHLRT